MHEIGCCRQAEVWRQEACATPYARWYRKRPDPNNWSPGTIENEVHGLIDRAPWWKVYDIAERLYVEVGKGDFTGTLQNDDERGFNSLFRERGIGWQMENGVIAVRGSEAFALATRDAVETMRGAETPTAANEIHEALTDISLRPTADATGAIQHAMAALECVARKIDGSTDTLGRIIGRLTLPPPLARISHRDRACLLGLVRICLVRRGHPSSLAWTSCPGCVPQGASDEQSRRNHCALL